VKAATAGWISSLTAGRPDEAQTKELLEAFGLSVPRRHGVPEAPLPREKGAAAEEAQRTEPGFCGPFVVKVLSPDILHKTDRGGVLLNVDAAGLDAAANDMLSRFPGCSVLIEEQVRFEGTEFILGALRDPTFGPTVMAGAGGILTELLKDVAFRLVPCSRAEALRMLKELLVYPALAGFRGLVMDPQGLADTITRVSALVEDLGDRFFQLDINPLVFTRVGWVVLDAKLILQ
jgi:hypothetical protein